MYAVTQLLAGLLVAHIAWAYFFLCGTILRTPRYAPEFDTSKVDRANAGLEVIVSTGTGMAITGLLAFFVGILHAIYPITAFLWLGILVLVFVLLDDSPFKARFWVARAKLVRHAATWPMLVIYGLSLVLSVPALVADPGSDATAAYWAYALDWANAHQIYVDQWLRFPYYAYNAVSLDTWMIELGALDQLNFLGWLTGCLSLLGICAFVSTFAPKRLSPRLVHIAALLTPLCLLCSPTFLHWVDTGLKDVTIGFFFFVVFTCVLLIMQTRERRLIGDLILCAAFFVGLKMSLVVFLPVALICTLLCLLVTKTPPRYSAVLVAVLICLSSLWYVKNFIQAGDPIAPTLNLALHGVDSKWSKADMKDLMGDLTVGTSPKELLRIPLDIEMSTPSLSFREPGVTWILFFVWVPAAVLMFAIIRRRSWPGTVFIAAALLVYAISYWTATSHLARYTLLFDAAFDSAVAVGILILAAALPRARIVAVALIALLAVPSPASALWLNNFWQGYYVQLWQGYQNRTQSLEMRSVAYPEIEYVGNALRKYSPDNRRAYALQLEFIHFFAIDHGFVSIGDWFGPERYIDFKAAIESNSIPAYIARFRIGAFIIPTPGFLNLTPRAPSPADLVQFDGEMRAIGFDKVWKPGWHYVVYLPKADA